MSKEKKMIIMKVFRCIIKPLLFVATFLCMFLYLQTHLLEYDDYNYQNIKGFYLEEENSIDAVYIGSSNCFEFWNSLIAWKKYGITVWPYASNGQTFYATKAIIKEARKTQPQAIFIVNINSVVQESVTYVNIHRLNNCMPLSSNKLQLIKELTNRSGYGFPRNLEFYIPMIRFHSRWSELDFSLFKLHPHVINGYKGASAAWHYTDAFDNIRDDIAELINEDISEEPEIPFSLVEYIDDLLAYCKEENIPILFVSVPRVETNKTKHLLVEKTGQLINDKGFDVLNLSDKYNEIGLNVECDYYDTQHTNIHGSIKYTCFLSEYIINNFDLKGNKNSKISSDWDDSFERYNEEILSSRVPEYALNSAWRDYSLGTITNFSVKVEGNTAVLNWDDVASADGYVVFRKEGESGKYVEIAEIEDSEYIDDHLLQNSEQGYGYTVAPYLQSREGKRYGDYVCTPQYVKP